MYAADHRDCPILFGLYLLIKQSFVHYARVMAVILDEIIDIFAHNFLSSRMSWFFLVGLAKKKTLANAHEREKLI